MTLPSQQPPLRSASASQPVTSASAGGMPSASLNATVGADRFAEGARMGVREQSAAPFDGGIVADPVRVFAGPGYNFPPTPVNRPAQFALWLSVIAVLFPFALVGSVGGGIWGLIHAHYNHRVGRRQAAAALIISALSIGWWLFVWAALAGLLPASLDS